MQYFELHAAKMRSQIKKNTDFRIKNKETAKIEITIDRGETRTTRLMFTALPLESDPAFKIFRNGQWNQSGYTGGDPYPRTRETRRSGVESKPLNRSTAKRVERMANETSSQKKTRSLGWNQREA